MDAAAARQADGTSYLPAISADGRFVAFQSDAANLVGDDSQRIATSSCATARPARSSASARTAPGTQADQLSEQPDITPDGRFVTFFSLATNLVPGDTNNRRDIFVRDRRTGTVVRVSVSTDGEEGNSESMWPKISDDGLVSAFQSNAFNLVPDDTNFSGDVFVHDRRPAADLTLAMDDIPDPVRKGTLLFYTLKVKNDGPASATDVVLTDELPEQTVFLFGLSTRGICTRSGQGLRGGTVTCNLGTLTAGASAAATIVVVPAQTGELTNTATVSGAQPDPETTNNSVVETTTVL